jgi:hypothetical protein
MADRSQHAGQIMENQTRYDLNAAIESWRQELAAQANLTAEVRRELETHLRDAITGFQQRGLNDEESFWLACKRVGQPPELGEEFVKANPAAVWRERMFWIASALLLLNLWWNLFSGIMLMLRLTVTIGNPGHFVSPTTYYLISLCGLIPIPCCIIILAGGWLRHDTKVLGYIFQSRMRLFLFGLLLVMVVDFVSADPSLRLTDGNFMPQRFFPSLLHDLLLLGLLAWFLPAQNQKTPKRA